MAASLQLFLTGGSGNSDPNASLGGVRSSTQVSGTAMNNLFDNVTPAEASAGDIEYRAIDIYNNGDAAAESIQAYLDPETTSEDTEIDLGLDSTTQTVGNESTAPTDVTFAHYTSSSKLSISNIAASGAQRLWLRRTVSSSAGNLANDSCTLKIEFA
ncbi:MAG: hypothetical protein GX443_18965 [Deltaproteobacteria bacterium]|nr:hypothetical protein [Deltaproteobacteria bacterium]